MRGRINNADRLQRLIAAGLLIVLNAVGIADSPDWTRFAALAVQVELLATGLVGWCPVYWSLGVSAKPDAPRT